jgi:putative transcriptional regulator
MDKNLFAELMGSVAEADEILRGERAPSREMHVSPVEVRAIRKATGLSQERFAKIMHVQVGTLRNWEQGRRDPTGPAKALLKVIKKDPKHVVSTLAEVG